MAEGAARPSAGVDATSLCDDTLTLRLLLSPPCRPGLRNSVFGLEFRSLTRSGVRSSVFTLCSSALGCGCLSLPYAVRVAGLGLCMPVMLFATAITILSGSVLVRHAAQSRALGSELHELGPVPSWASLLEEQFGALGGVTMDLIIFLLAGGVIVLYYSFTGDFLASLRDLAHVSEASLPRWALILCALVITVPLGFPLDIGALQGSSVFIVGTIVLLAVVATAGLFACNSVEEVPVDWVPTTMGGLLQAFCTFIFTEMFHLNIFSVFKSLRPPHLWSPRSLAPRADADKERMQNICSYAVVVSMLLNIWIALAGYLLWRGRTPQDFVLSYTTEPGCPGWIVTSAHITQVLLTLCTICGIPINVVPARLALASLVARAMGRARNQLPCQAPVGRFLLTATMCIGLAALAATTSSVAKIIGFLGGTLSTLVMFVLPALFYWRGSLDQGRPLCRALTLSAFLLGAVAGFSNVIALIADAITRSG